MAFKNELTFAWAATKGQESDIHRQYERALKELEEEVGPVTEFENIINGRRKKAKEKLVKYSPIDETMELGKFQLGTKEDVNAAVKAAAEAFEEWSRTDYTQRVEIFESAAKLLRKQKFRLAAALTLDNGKNRFEAVADVDEAIDFISFYAMQMRKHEGYQTTLGFAYPNERSVSFLRPYGPWAIVCPFNFPVAISLGMSTAALITGNTVVMKPSSLAPLALRLAFEVLEDAGLPSGVINYLAGSGSEVGKALIEHPLIEGVCFTGSKEVGFQIMKGAIREHPIPVIAEMGSKNPVIVTLDADMEKAVDAVITSTFGFGGQKCSACSRLYVQQRVKDDFEALLKERAERLIVGDPRIRENNYGPLIERKKVQEYLEHCALGTKDGMLLTGGQQLVKGKLKNGHYVEPAIITGIPNDHYLMQTELFMPILCTQPFDRLEEAVEMANRSAFGLTAGLFSEDAEEINYFFDHIQSGVAYANRRRGACTGAIVGSQSFVGWKASGSTGKGTGGIWYLQQFLREQTRTVAV